MIPLRSEIKGEMNKRSWKFNTIALSWCNLVKLPSYAWRKLTSKLTLWFFFNKSQSMANDSPLKWILSNSTCSCAISKVERAATSFSSNVIDANLMLMLFWKYTIGSLKLLQVSSTKYRNVSFDFFDLILCNENIVEQGVNRK